MKVRVPLNFISHHSQVSSNFPCIAVEIWCHSLSFLSWLLFTHINAIVVLILTSCCCRFMLLEHLCMWQLTAYDSYVLERVKGEVSLLIIAKHFPMEVLFFLFFWLVNFSTEVHEWLNQFLPSLPHSRSHYIMFPLIKKNLKKGIHLYLFLLSDFFLLTISLSSIFCPH